MTDNEKAATFIGWREGQPCSHREQIDGSQWGNGIQQCFLCHCRLPIDRCFHTDPAPPMADPRNYMKALEIAGRKFEWFQIQYQGGDSYWVTIGGYLDYDGSPYDYKSMADGKSTAEAVIATLAALYDAEHATQAGAEP